MSLYTLHNQFVSPLIFNESSIIQSLVFLMHFPNFEITLFKDGRPQRDVAKVGARPPPWIKFHVVASFLVLGIFFPCVGLFFLLMGVLFTLCKVSFGLALPYKNFCGANVTISQTLSYRLQA